MATEIKNREFEETLTDPRQNLSYMHVHGTELAELTPS
jgi:hypothetical protein